MQRLTLLVLLALGVHACVEKSDQAPEAGRRVLPPGALGQVEFKPQDWQEGTTSWWVDSDGVEPGIAGCHIGTDSDGVPNGRMFGETCRAGGILLETTPGAGVVHRHENDVGHSGQIDCKAWCVGTGSGGGTCEIAAAPPCAQSARCLCD
jgi:hypothetical protein